MFLTPHDGEFAGRTQIAWSEAAAAPLCLLTPDMQNRRIIDGIFRSVGAKPVPAVETNSIFNLVSHVAAGQWSAIVPRQLLRFFGVPAGTRAIELVEPTARPDDRARDERPRTAFAARPKPFRHAMAGRHRGPDRAAKPGLGRG